MKANNHEANACFSRVVLSIGMYSSLKKAWNGWHLRCVNETDLLSAYISPYCATADTDFWHIQTKSSAVINETQEH